MFTKNLFTVVLCLTIALATPRAEAQSQIPYLQTTNPAGSAVFNGVMYLFYVHAGQPNGYLFYQTSNGTTWSTPTAVPQAQQHIMASSGEPRATVFNNRLYVFYTSGSTIYYWSMDSAGNWTSVAGTVPGATTPQAPGVTGFNGRLYAAWRATGSNSSLFYSSMDTSGNWTASVRLSTGETSRAPSLVSFVAADGNEYMYGVWKNRACQDCVETMWYAKMSPFSGWGLGTQLESGDYPMTARDQSLAATANGLAVVYTGGHNAGLYYKNLNASHIWQNEVLVDASAPRSGTAASFIAGHLHAFYYANGFIYEEILY
jgi:hypothetical protein